MDMSRPINSIGIIKNSTHNSSHLMSNQQRKETIKRDDTISGNRDSTKAENKLLSVNKADIAFLSVSEKAVIEAVNRINKIVEGVNICFEYSIHKGTNEVMLKLLNKETNEVVCEIPPEKVLDVVAERMQVLGLIMDERR